MVEKNATKISQAKGNKFEKLSTKEKRTLLARILEEEFVNPIQVINANAVIYYIYSLIFRPMGSHPS